METSRQKLIRTGKITPFSNIQGLEKAHIDNIFDDEGASDDEFLPNTDENVTELYQGEVGDDQSGRNEDDGNEMFYQKRYQIWAEKRRQKRFSHRQTHSLVNKTNTMPIAEETEPLDNEAYTPIGTVSDADIQGEFKIPGEIYTHLFEYQRTCTRWLWELHCQGVGGIIGDEMGLGKTIQIIAFLAGLGYSRLLEGPIIIICPATVLKQWVQEFHKWWPAFRVAILHSSGSGMTAGRKNFGEESDESDYNNARKPSRSKLPSSNPAIEKLIRHIAKNGHVLVTTYSAVRIYTDALTSVKWSYAVLDEGHKIRNPDAGITQSCKRLKVPYSKTDIPSNHFIWYSDSE